MNADGTGQTHFSDQPFFTGFGPAWSPDGTRFAFASGRDGDFEVYAMNADGLESGDLTAWASRTP